MSNDNLSRALTVMVLVGSLALACGQGGTSARVAEGGQTLSGVASAAPKVLTVEVPVQSRADGAAPANVLTASEIRSDVGFSGTREETESFIRYYKAIRLSPEQERVKTQALSSIPAPCCADNPLATCCCPCNMAKAAWGLSAWLITEKGYGADEVHQAAKDWLAAANPNGFTGDACYSSGCGRPIHQNGCGGMDDRKVL